MTVNKSFKWWYGGILPVSLVAYYLIDRLEDDVFESTPSDMEGTSNIEIVNEKQSEVIIPDKNPSIHGDGVITNTSYFSWEKTLGNASPINLDTNVDKNIIIENKTCKISISQELNELLESKKLEKYTNGLTSEFNNIGEDVEPDLSDVNINDHKQRLYQTCINEVILQDRRFDSHYDLMNFVIDTFESEKTHPKLANILIDDLEEKIYDIEFMKLLVTEETSRIRAPSPYMPESSQVVS